MDSCIMKQIIILMLLVVSMATVFADERTIPNSKSPNDQYELTALASSKDSPAYEIGLRQCAENKVINLGKVNGYVYFNAADNPLNTRVLWSPDSRFLALYLRDGRHNGGTSIYSVNENRVQEIRFDDLEEVLRPNLGGHDTRGFFVQPEFWGPNYELFLSVEGTQLNQLRESFRFIVALQLVRAKDGAYVGKTKSVKEDRSAELFPPQIETAEVLVKDFEREDAELNAIYKKVIALLNEDAKKKLVASQRSWISFRDAQASVDADLDQSGCLALRNKIELTQQRIATLRMRPEDSR